MKQTMYVTLHCDNDSVHLFPATDFTPGEWCPICGEGAALRNGPQSNGRQMERCMVAAGYTSDAWK